MKKNIAGFTLIELVSAIAVVTALTRVFLPAIQ
jgi:prepilin-type N-terminal cleavage/methylation domain-containing protein